MNKEAPRLGAVFERCVEKSPISVMVRAARERVLGADRLALWCKRTAQKQYTRDLLFSSVYDLRNHVVFCVQPSVRAAYQAPQDDVGATLVSVYNKLKHIETHTAAELVRYSAREFAPLIAYMGGARTPWLEGYRITMVDGHYLAASAHRIAELRAAKGRVLPGTSLVVYEPAQGLVTDVLPCEHGHAQERALFGALLQTVEAGVRWIADHKFCTRDLLCTIDTRGAFFITRAPRWFKFELVEALRVCGRPGLAVWRNNRAKWWRPKARRMSAGGYGSRCNTLPVMGPRLSLYCPTSLARCRTNESLRSPARAGRWQRHCSSSKRICMRQSIRWATPKRPSSALVWLSWRTTSWRWCWRRCVGCMAMRGVHGEETVDDEVSLYDVANEMTTPYHGMMIAIPALAWDVFDARSPADLAAIVLALAQKVRLQAMRKSPRRPQKPRPPGKKPAGKGHVATAKLLMNRQAKSATP